MRSSRTFNDVKRCASSSSSWNGKLAAPIPPQISTAQKITENTAAISSVIGLLVTAASALKFGKELYFGWNGAGGGGAEKARSSTTGMLGGGEMRDGRGPHNGDEMDEGHSKQQLGPKHPLQDSGKEPTVVSSSNKAEDSIAALVALLPKLGLPAEQQEALKEKLNNLNEVSLLDQSLVRSSIVQSLNNPDISVQDREAILKHIGDLSKIEPSTVFRQKQGDRKGIRVRRRRRQRKGANGWSDL